MIEAHAIEYTSASPSTIAVYGPTCALEVADPQPVDQHVVVTAEPRDGPAHREVRRVVDVQPVDVRDGRGAHADGDGPTADDRGEPLALGGRQRLGVADARGSGGSWAA